MPAALTSRTAGQARKRFTAAERVPRLENFKALDTGVRQHDGV